MNRLEDETLAVVEALLDVITSYERAADYREMKRKLGRAMLKKLKVYAGPAHPHAAQNPTAWNPGARAWPWARHWFARALRMSRKKSALVSCTLAITT